jgi:hypothetical protein
VPVRRLVYLANLTNSEIGLWPMGAEILGGSSASTKESTKAMPPP